MQMEEFADAVKFNLKKNFFHDLISKNIKLMDILIMEIISASPVILDVLHALDQIALNAFLARKQIFIVN